MALRIVIESNTENEEWKHAGVSFQVLNQPNEVLQEVISSGLIETISLNEAFGKTAEDFDGLYDEASLPSVTNAIALVDVVYPSTLLGATTGDYDDRSADTGVAVLAKVDIESTDRNVVLGKILLDEALRILLDDSKEVPNWVLDVVKLYQKYKGEQLKEKDTSQILQRKP